MLTRTVCTQWEYIDVTRLYGFFIVFLSGTTIYKKVITTTFCITYNEANHQTSTIYNSKYIENEPFENSYICLVYVSPIFTVK